MDRFLPGVGGTAGYGDEYLFAESGGMMSEAIGQSTRNLFRQEFEEEMLNPGDPGYAAQRPKIDKFLKDSGAELRATNQQAQMGVEAQRRLRLGNQTGGLRNGIARNPFNMNMMRGPLSQPLAAQRPTTNPAYLRPSGGGGGQRSDIQPQAELMARNYI